MKVKKLYKYVGIIVALAPWFANCSDAGGVTPIPDAEGDPEDATVVDNRLRCGAEPYVLAKIRVTTTQGAPLSGITFSSPMCPGVSQLSDDKGDIEGYVTQNVAFYARFDADAYAAVLTSEQRYKKDNFVAVPMLPRFITGILPNYDPKRGAILISLTKNSRAPSPCGESDAVHLSVKEAPSARVIYFSEGAVPTAIDGATETSKAGFAAILDLDLGQPVTLIGKKKRCVVSFAENGATGRAPLEQDRITLMAGAVQLPLPVDGGADASVDSSQSDAQIDAPDDVLVTDAATGDAGAVDAEVNMIDGTSADAGD